MLYTERIKALRSDQSLTQGLRDLPTTTLIALADIYHTSTDYLLGRTNDPKPPVSL